MSVDKAVRAKRPDVAIISPFPRLDRSGRIPSGVARYTSDLVEALELEGAEVRVIAPRIENEPDIAVRGSLTIERVYEPGVRAMVDAARAACQSGAPVVHLQYEVFLYGGPLSLGGLPIALAMLRRHRLGPVVTMHQVVDTTLVDAEFTKVHRVNVPPPVARVSLATIQMIVRKLARTTIVHEQAFARVLPGSVVVPLGVRRVEGRSQREARRRLGIGDGALVVLCFGFLSPYKGLEAALRAARIAGGAIQLIIAGGEHPRLAGHDTYAADIAREFGDAARFTGYVAHEDLESYFFAADIALLPYPRPFASSGPLAEAIGFGTPPICSPALGECAGLPDEMIAPIEPTGLARRLVELGENPSELEQLRKITVDLALERTWSNVANRHLEIYRRCAND